MTVAHQQGATSVNMLMGQSPETAKLYFDGLADADLNEAESRQFNLLLGTWLGVFQQSVVLREKGFLDTDFADHMDGQFEWVVEQPGFAKYWSAWGPSHGLRFRRMVDESMPQPGGVAAQQSAAADSA